jgi:ABC-type sugar transport system ATPase subunit
MTSEGDPTAILEIRGITKEFSGVKALDDVSMSFRPGEVHALVGENGAGKSTLMKILSGVYQPTRGSLSFAGKAVAFRNPKQAQDAGIGIIFQEFSLIRNFDVADNVFLNREPSRGAGVIDKAAERRRAISLFQEIGFDIDVDRTVEELSVVEQQVVEIVKALSVAAKVLIMDEPSAVLTDKELKRLFRIIRALKARGVTVIYISHMLDEVFEICDRVTVLKDGRVVGTKPIGETDKGDLVRMMVGREISEFFPEASASRGEVLLEARGIGVRGRLRGVSFELRAGEILGIAGMAGSGQAALVGAVIGTLRRDEGELLVCGERARMRDFREAVARGIGYISEDRKSLGILSSMSLKDNITIADLGAFLRLGFLLPRREREAAKAESDRLRIKSAGLGQRIETLSGGNQQKALLARWLLMKPRILVLVEPTRGVDVGAKMEIYRIMREFVDSGRAVLMVSSELPELIGLSDRILVMRGGAIEGAIDQAEGLATEEMVMSMAVGHRYSYAEEASS